MEGEAYMAISYVRVIDTQLVGQEFKQNTNKYNIINENEDKFKSIKNDSFYQSNQYVGKDCLGRDLDLTYLIDKPNGYLQGKLSDSVSREWSFRFRRPPQ